MRPFSIEFTRYAHAKMMEIGKSEDDLEKAAMEKLSMTVMLENEGVDDPDERRDVMDLMFFVFWTDNPLEYTDENFDPEIGHSWVCIPGDKEDRKMVLTTVSWRQADVEITEGPLAGRRIMIPHADLDEEASVQ